jgi:hypothetical protein
MTQIPGPETTTRQPELDLDYSPALDEAMRALFEFRWSRWHRAKTYEEAIADPVTRRLLALQVLHSPSRPTPRRPRVKPPQKKQAQPA